MIKKITLILALTLVTSYLVADKIATIQTDQDIVFEGQILFASDTLMYVWTGLQDFDQSNLQHVLVMPFSKIKRIKLGKALTWGQGIKKILPVTLVTSTVIVVSNFKNEPADGIFAFMSLFNLMFAIPGGAIVSLGSHASVDFIDNPSPQDFDCNTGKYRKFVILTSTDAEFIDRLILEVKP